MSNATIDLKTVENEYAALLSGAERTVYVCTGPGCAAAGSFAIYDEFKNELEKQGVHAVVKLKPEDHTGTFIKKVGCNGLCQKGPLVTVDPEGILYTKVTSADVSEIVSKTIKEGKPVDRLLYKDGEGRLCPTRSDIRFYNLQEPLVLKTCDVIDFNDIDEYIYRGGYSAIEKVVKTMTPEGVCRELIESGLRGRGGGGFSTGKKVDATRVAKGDKKYVVCNGDEGDPGAFMDRSVMEGNPHAVLEGMMIEGFGCGADEGYIYVRAEYPLSVEHLAKAIADAETYGLLGDNIFGSGFNFRIHVYEGAGAFVCGEASAMAASIQGMRGMPWPKPPRMSEQGLWGKPTLLNNVETLATVPLIMNMGAAEYRKTGTENSPGTKIFALTGHVANTGLIEVPFGTTLREIIFDIGGGVVGADGSVNEENFKAVQIGGPSGGCLTKEHLDLPLDYDSLSRAGAMVGSGGLVVMNKDTCMVNVARFFMKFTQEESCGKCTPCREGTKQMLFMLDDVVRGRGSVAELDLLEELGHAVSQGSLCGLGKSAPGPVLSTLRYFRDEYTAHVRDKKCPVGECKDLVSYRILTEECVGCTACARACPVGAITGEVKKQHTIDGKKCIKCGACKTACRFHAVEVA